jgi:hypothetical protein
VAEPSYHIALKAPAAKGTAARLRALVEDHKGEVKWLYLGRRGRGSEANLRVVSQHIDDLTTALEAAGFEVIRVVSSMQP